MTRVKNVKKHLLRLCFWRGWTCLKEQSISFGGDLDLRCLSTVEIPIEYRQPRIKREDAVDWMFELSTVLSCFTCNYGVILIAHARSDAVVSVLSMAVLARHSGATPARYGVLWSQKHAWKSGCSGWYGWCRVSAAPMVIITPSRHARRHYSGAASTRKLRPPASVGPSVGTRCSRRAAISDPISRTSCAFTYRRTIPPSPSNWQRWRCNCRSYCIF